MGERERGKREGASKRGQIGKKEAQDLNSFCASSGCMYLTSLKPQFSHL